MIDRVLVINKTPTNMKMKLVLCMLILANVVFSIKCQEIDYMNFYKNLDSTRITTGLLYNRVIPFTKIQDFTGVSDTVVSNSDNWIQLYYELNNSRPTPQPLSNIVSFCDSIGKDTINFRVPIGILNVKYNLIKDNALDDSLLIIQDSLLWDGPNTSDSPYTTHRCFAAAALISNCPTSEMTFFLSNDYLFENTGEEILYYEIDFDDGYGPATLYNNEEYTLNYSQSGEKEIAIKAFMSNGDTLRCKSTFMVNENIQIQQGSLYSLGSLNGDGEMLKIPDNKLDTSIISVTYNGETYEGTYGIWYGCNNNYSIKKPVIIVEGYDPFNTNELSDGSLFDIMKQAELIASLKNNGCDVIVLNFKYGSIKIQNNAMVLRALIDKINHLKVTKNELVIVGASMGGLVARYALSYMEQQQEDHQTRLFISLDSPNQGAYGSLAGQQLLTRLYLMALNPLVLIFKYSLTKELSKKMSFMDSWAGRQMLVYHHFAQNGKTANPDPLRTAFLEEMAAFPNNGYPQSCRNVAMTCGNGYGVGQGYDAGSEQINMDVQLGNTYAQLKVNALPDHNNLQILDFNAGARIPWKFLRKKGIITFPYIVNLQKSVNNTDPYDNCPGSHYSMLFDLGRAIEDLFKVNPANDQAECFIPTVSALDLNKSKLEQWAQTKDYNYLMSNIHEYMTFDGDDCCEISDHTKTPFDALYVGDENLSHITGGGITTKTVGWINKEINRETILINNIDYLNEDKQFEAKRNIIASSINNHVTILANSHITYLAGESIILNPGFQVNSGATFLASINNYECSFTSSAMISNYTSAPKNIFNVKNSSVTTPVTSSAQRNNELSISPNPSQGSFDLNSNWNINISGLVSIYNSTGKLVYQEKMLGTTKRIQINQPSGVYLLKATNGENFTFSSIIIIK